MSPINASTLRIRRLPVLTLVAMAILAIAVSTAVNSPVQAAAGKIYVTNEWSLITNEPAPPGPYTFSNTVFSTYGDDPLVGLNTGRIIKPGSDVVKVVIVDSELNPPVPIAVTNSSNITLITGGSNDTISTTVGNTAVIELTGLGTSSPIAGSLADVQANTVLSVDGGTTNLTGTQLSIISFFRGNALGDPWIRVVVNVSGPYVLNYIQYETAVVGSALVTVKSDLENTDITFLAKETGIGTGRFEGFIQLIENGVTKISGDGSTAASTGASGAVDVYAGAGPISVSFKDNASNTQETLVSIDNAAPVNTVTSPSPGSATQDRTPIFSGTVVDAGSGLMINEFDARWDNTDDPNDSVPVINVVNGNDVAADVQSLNVSTTGAVDGDFAFSFSWSPPFAIPDVPGSVDNIVDWVIVSADLAGNVGLSDVDPATNGVQLPTVKIDTINPGFTHITNDHKTGLAWNGTNEVVARNSLRVAFNDGLTNVQPSDFTVKLDSGAVFVPTSVTVVNTLVDADGIPFNVFDSNSFTFDELLKPLSSAARSAVYFELAADLASNDTPLVSIQDAISDLAGNVETLGDREVSDGLGPLLIVTLSGGSGTGTGDEGPDQLTRDQMSIGVQSDESLSAQPFVQVFSDVGDVDDTPTALAQGTNIWTATFQSEGDADGKRAVKVTATDIRGNTSTLGSDDAENPGTPVFRLDTWIPNPVISLDPADAPDSRVTPSVRPQITINHIVPGEASTVTLLDVQLDGVQVEGDFVRLSNGRIHRFTPSVDLAVGQHLLVIPTTGAVDAAGNETVMFQYEFTVDPPASAVCRADINPTGLIERFEAVDVVVSYLLGRGEWTRAEAIEVLTAYLLQTPLNC